MYSHVSIVTHNVSIASQLTVIECVVAFLRNVSEGICGCSGHRNPLFVLLQVSEFPLVCSSRACLVFLALTRIMDESIAVICGEDAKVSCYCFFGMLTIVQAAHGTDLLFACTDKRETYFLPRSSGC